MKKRVTFFIILLLLFSYLSPAQKKKEEKDKQKVFSGKLTYFNLSSSSFFDLSDNQISELDISNDSTSKIIRYDYSAHTLLFEGEYKVMDNLFISGEIPFTFYTLEERFYIDTLNEYVQYDSKNFSRSMIDYYGIGLKYKFLNEKVYGFVTGKVRIPHNFKNKIDISSKDAFISDGAYEFLIGTILGYNMKNIKFETEFEYNNRADILEDRLLSHTSITLSTVPKTHLRFFTDLAFSTKSYDNAIAFFPQYTPVQESYWNAGFVFSFSVFDFDAEFGYRVRVWGKNTLNQSTVIFRIGIGL